MSNRLSLSERLVRAVAVIVVVGTVIMSAVLLLVNSAGNRAPVLEDTPLSIEKIRPTGELYVLICYTEEYVMKDTISNPIIQLNTGLNIIDNAVNSATSLFDKKHKCIQMEKAQVSFFINLDSVNYDIDKEEGVVYVTLPKVEFKLSPQGAPFLSDDEAFWKDYDTNILKKEVKRKIERKFDTPENRNKAMLYAMSVLGGFIRQCGMEARFMNQYLERKEE